MPQRDIPGFIAYWSAASPSERSNSQRFLLELCELLEVPAPDHHPHAGYFFEHPVTEHHLDGSTSTGRIDLYKRACFVLESKQFQEAQAAATQLELAAEAAGVVAKKKSSQPVRGTDAWDDAMIKARGQAERYVRALPASEPNPPFLVVVDVGHTFELFADFTQAGKAYLPFPDPRTFRIRLADLADAKIRERLRLVWTDPAALDPAKQSADVTREVSGHLAELAKSLEQAGHAPDIVAQFLTRCLFCMFAEDVELLPRDSFRELLESLPADGAGFEQLVQQLFRELNTGTGQGISVVLRKKLLHFNGGLFADDTVLPINGLQLALLKNAARQHWASVEPAIFGTLLERALNPDERHQLGAHFTPRAYVERLVLPAVIEPLRAEWANVRAAAITHGARSSELMAKVQEYRASSRSKQDRGDYKGAEADSRHAREEEKAAAAELSAARTALNDFHSRLCHLKVLDPACGTGNFLYVALQQLKVLEGELFDLAAQFEFGENLRLEMEKSTVDPHQFLGLEINPRAAAIAELVLWIGYLQWHFRLHGKRTPPEPILRAFKNIECRDAVLAYDGEPQPVTWAMAAANPDLPGLPDEVRAKLRSSGGAAVLRRPIISSPPPAATEDQGGAAAPPHHDDEVITVWDRRSTKPDPVTGRAVPDETKRVPLLAYTNPRPADWPAADFIVGNPPFIGNKRMRDNLGDGYAETLRAAYPEMTETADFVMYWWHKAATLVRAGRAQRFGLITTNSLRQTFARRVVQLHLGAPVSDPARPEAPQTRRIGDRRSAGKERGLQSASSASQLSTQTPLNSLSPLSLVFAIPDHPWVDTAEGAAVRIAMTVGVAGEHPGELLEVTAEQPQDDGSEQVTLSSQRGKISADLTVGAELSAAKPLRANEGLSFMGVSLIGQGFVLEAGNPLAAPSQLVRPYVIGRDLNQEPQPRFVIDLFGLSAEQVRHVAPSLYQHVLTAVKPERDQNNRPAYRDKWWIFGEARAGLRKAIGKLTRYIVTCRTASHRVFAFVPGETVVESTIIAIATDDAWHLGVLSSRIHTAFALAAGSRLGVGNDPRYNNSLCFDPFPFPLCGEAERERIRKLAEELDAHRKRVQAQHPGLTLTGLYNVLEKLRAADDGVGPRCRAAQISPSAPEAQTKVTAAEHRSPTGLSAKEKLIHDQGLVSVLKQLHDELDVAVFEAYGWSDLVGLLLGKEPDEVVNQEILTRLVALNAERAAEEQRGIIHWLRPDYQSQSRKPEAGSRNEQKSLALPEGTAKPKPRKSSLANRKSKIPWPKSLAERVQAVEAALHAAGRPVAPEELARTFARARPAAVTEILQTLVTLGRARRQGDQFTR